MQNQKKRFVILCHGAFNYIKNKTGNMLIRYRPDEVVAVIDREKVGLLASKLRDIRPPAPYKGKGILYDGEKILRKAGKTGK